MHEDLVDLRRAIERLWTEAEALARAVDRELAPLDRAAPGLTSERWAAPPRPAIGAGGGWPRGPHWGR